MGVFRDRFVTGKGDVPVARAPGRLENLPVGTDGQVLTANSAADLGVEWAAASGGPGTYIAGDPLFGNYSIMADDGYVDVTGTLGIIFAFEDIGGGNDKGVNVGAMVTETDNDADAAHAILRARFDPGNSQYNADLEIQCVDDPNTPSIYTYITAGAMTNDGNKATLAVRAEDSPNACYAWFWAEVSTGGVSIDSQAATTVRGYNGTNSCGVDSYVDVSAGAPYAQFWLSMANGQTLDPIILSNYDYTPQIWGITATGAEHFFEQTDPAAPAANEALLYARDNGSGKTQLCVRFPTGAVQVLATEP